MDDIRDIRPPIETAWLIWLIAAIGVIFIAVVIYVLFFKSKQKNNQPLPWDKALFRLTSLQAKGYPAQGQFKLFYSELSDIVRRYLEERFQMNAPEMTTEEFLHHCQTTTELTDEHKQSLKDFLYGSDLVKFAKHEPSAAEAQANFDLARKLVLDTQPVEIKHGV